MYIGHRRENGEIQSLRDHLEGVARRAEAFGGVFGAGRHARRTGLMHDIGKYAPDVQKRMADPEHVAKVNHTSAGAIVAVQAYRDLSAAFAVAGHHGGLADLGAQTNTAQDGTLHGKLRYTPKDFSAYQEEIKLEKGELAPAWARKDPLAASFYTRMLFSCLVDADFLDTEAFLAESQVLRGDGENMAALLDKLIRFIRPWFPAKRRIDERRCEILTRCLEMGQSPKGLYTLTVPTGGGKTVSSLAFALTHAVKHDCSHIIYVVPYMSIIEQTAAKFSEILGEENVLEHHSGVEYEESEEDDGVRQAAQRKRLATENWDSPVIVTTAVQFFESLYACKTSKCRKLHSIAGSVVIFDEAQMMPLPYLRPCVYAIAELVRHYGVTAVLCTATQPALDGLFYEYAPELTVCELMKEPTELYEYFRRVTFFSENTMSEEELAQKLSGYEQVLCIVNTRKRARNLYDGLPEEGRFHLSTLMTPEDRRSAIRLIRKRLASGQACRVVSTSLIEAGVDVDFPTVWREESGLDSILQAAGRCNREAKQSKEQSVVHVFAVDQHPPRAYRKQIDALHLVQEMCSEMDSLKAIELYSRAVIQAKGEHIDQKGILDACQRMLFRTVGRDFKMIEQDTLSVYIPNSGNAEKIERLRRGDYDRQMIRGLQRDSVSVYRGHAEALLGAGKIWRTEDGFLILVDAAAYTPDKGLELCEDSGQAVFL